jgi:hypothetical protein
MSTTRHVYAMFDRLEDALAAYAEVQASGCSTEHCSAMLHEKHIDEAALTGGERASPEGAAKGAAVGGAAGVVLGGLAALGGGILGVGPLAAAAFAGGVMAAYGALLGGIAGSDEPEHHLRAMQRELETGKVLIAIETDDPKLRAMCETVFETHGGRRVTF